MDAALVRLFVCNRRVYSLRLPVTTFEILQCQAFISFDALHSGNDTSSIDVLPTMRCYSRRRAYDVYKAL